MSNRIDGMHCVGTGFIALDIIRVPIDDNTVVERRYAGGSCGNVLSILSYLGMSTSAVGRIGDDVPGSELLADLRKWKVNVKHLVTEPMRRTPIVIQEIYLDALGRPRHRFFMACPACGAMMPPFRPVLVAKVPELSDVLPSHKLFYFDRVSPGIVELARRSREQGALVIFEPSGVKDESLFIKCLQLSHVLKYSNERLSGLDTLVKRANVPIEIETLGREGLRYRMRKSKGMGGWQRLAGFDAPLFRDAAGSGDWCTAGFIASLSGQPNLFTAITSSKIVSKGLQMGQAMATLNCGYDGARGLMYAASRTEVMKAAEQLLSQREPKLPQRETQPLIVSRKEQACVVCSAI